jgi:hypothetical protein
VVRRRAGRRHEGVGVHRQVPRIHQVRGDLMSSLCDDVHAAAPARSPVNDEISSSLPGSQALSLF